MFLQLLASVDLPALLLFNSCFLDILPLNLQTGTMQEWVGTLAKPPPSPVPHTVVPINLRNRAVAAYAGRDFECFWVIGNGFIMLQAK